MAQMVLIWS